MLQNRKRFREGRTLCQKEHEEENVFLFLDDILLGVGERETGSLPSPLVPQGGERDTYCRGRGGEDVLGKMSWTMAR